MEKVWVWIAYHMPRKLAYWTYIRVAASATVNEYSDRTPEEVNILEALRSWK